MKEIKKEIKPKKKEVVKRKTLLKSKSMNFSEMYALKNLAHLRLIELNNEGVCSSPKREEIEIYTGIIEKLNVLLDNEMKIKILE